LSIYHVVALLYRLIVQRVPWTMIPLVEDLKHLWHDLLFYFGRRKRKAYYGRYNYAEKAEYLAVVWGTLIMIITGFMMWNPIATTNFLPGQFIPAAKAAHGGRQCWPHWRSFCGTSITYICAISTRACSSAR
jgi:thiosulfate reductase cytochrome b subunit